LDFAFPGNSASKEHWITLDETVGTDEYTIIFATSALQSPAFLSQPALHELTPEEQKQLSDLSAQLKANVVGVEVIKTGASPFVSVKVPQNAQEGASVIFRVRIEHK
jgi:hypothetical protein